MTCAREAWEEAGRPPRVWVGIASGLAGTDAAWEGERERSVTALGDAVADALGAVGSATFTTTCASAVFALEQAQWELVSGGAETAVLVGVEALSPMIARGFEALGALDARSFWLGEAASAVVVTLPRPDARAHVVAQGVCADARHPTRPDATGAALRRALEAGSLGDVEEVVLTAGGSPAYASIYSEVLGGRRAHWRGWEDRVGHLLGASGVVGLGWAATSGRRSVVVTVGFGGVHAATWVTPEAVGAAPARLWAVECEALEEVEEAPEELEEWFPGRWDARRRLPARVRCAAAAVRGLEVDGVVVGGVVEGLAEGRRFAGWEGPRRPGWFLEALPSTPASLLGGLLGAEGYQATVSGISAEAHARAVVALGRAERVVAVELTGCGARARVVARAEGQEACARGEAAYPPGAEEGP